MKLSLKLIKSPRSLRDFFIASIHGFNFCRPMIIIDATFLVGKHKGALLVAVGKDANQGPMHFWECVMEKRVLVLPNLSIVL